jgi:hypothetical protein
MLRGQIRDDLNPMPTYPLTKGSVPLSAAQGSIAAQDPGSSLVHPRLELDHERDAAWTNGCKLLSN